MKSRDKIKASPGTPADEKLFENHPDPFDSQNFWTVDELAKLLHLDSRTIRNWMSRREIPFVKVGRRTIFLRDSVRKWLLSKEIKPHGYR